MSERPHLRECSEERPARGTGEVGGGVLAVGPPCKATRDEPEVEREGEERAKDHEEIEEAKREDE